MCDLSLLHRVPTATREPPGALVLVHLKQLLMDARVYASGDERLIFKRLRAKGSPSSGVVPRACLRDGEGRSCIASSVPERTLCQRSSARQLAHQELRCVGRECGDEARKGIVSARVVLGHDGLARSAKGEAEVVDHGGDQGAAHDAAGHEGGKRSPECRAKAQPAAGAARGGLPLRVVRQVAAERSADRGPQLSVESDQQILIQNVPVDAHVTHKLGDISALPGGDHLSGGRGQRCQSQSASHRKLAPTPNPVH